MLSKYNTTWSMQKITKKNIEGTIRMVQTQQKLINQTLTKRNCYTENRYLYID